MRSKYYGKAYEKKHNHAETEILMRQMKKASDLEVCEKIVALGKQVIKENGGFDIQLYARDSKGKEFR